MRLKTHINKIDSQEGKHRSSNEKTAASPSPFKPRDKNRDAAAHGSPLLKSKQSTGDLMFQMDDEPLLSALDSGKGKSVDRHSRPADENDTRPWNDNPGLGSSLQDTTSFVGGRSCLDDRMASPQDASIAKSPSRFQPTTPQGKQNGSISPPHSSQVPWNSTPISGSKKALKDIMSEASESRVSNISLGMSTRKENTSSVPKLSQKERKKMQQQQMQEMATAQQKAKEAAQSPWKLPTPSQAPVDTSPNGQDVPSPMPSSKSTQKPGMTLRQTVSGAPSPKPQNSMNPVPPKGRSVSGTTKPPQPSDIAAPSTSPNDTTGPPPSIQSIRHIPRPEPYQTSFHSDSASSMSLATILMQQQTEKDEIREAATAKHNLQDIQAEQAFQEWWDKESRRVQGIPEPDAEPNQDERDHRGGRSGRGNKGSGQRKRRGKGPQGVSGSVASPQQPARNDSEPASTPKNAARNSSPHHRHQQTQTAKKPPTDSAARGSSSRRGRGGHRGKQSQGERA